MSNIIKSFRVIEKESEDDLEIEPSVNVQENQYKEKYLEIISDAKKQADILINKALEEEIQIINRANANANNIVEETEKKSKKILEDSKKSGYKVGEEEGYKEGYKIGHQEGREQADNIIKEAMDIKNKNIVTREEIAKELEPEIINMIITIYEKIIGDRIKEEDFIIDLVKKGISSLDPTDELTIIVSKDDYEKVLENKEQILAGASFINKLNIKYDINFKQRDCIFEMDKGSIDLSLDDQLEELKKTILKILDNE